MFDCPYSILYSFIVMPDSDATSNSEAYQTADTDNTGNVSNRSNTCCSIGGAEATRKGENKHSNRRSRGIGCEIVDGAEEKRQGAKPCVMVLKPEANNWLNEEPMIQISKTTLFTSVERGFPVKSSVRTARVFICSLKFGHTLSWGGWIEEIVHHSDSMQTFSRNVISLLF